MKSLTSETEAQWLQEELAELWAEARSGYKAESEYLDLDGYIFFRVMIDLLRNAGAIDYPGSVCDDSGPGMSSSFSLLYGHAPKVVVDTALRDLKSMLHVPFNVPRE